MKQFFKMMFASLFGVLLAVGVIILIAVFMFIGLVSTFSSGSSFTPASNTVMKIDLTGTLTENTASYSFNSFFYDTDESLALKDILSAIRVAKNNRDIKGIYLVADDITMGAASANELRRALTDFKKSGKFIIAYADSYSQKNYFLCSVADKVFLNPQGQLLLNGMASETMFYKGLLQKVGIDMQVFKVGTYKGAVEPFMLDHLSNANREQIESYMGGIWNSMTTGIAESRKITADKVNEFANKGLFFDTAEKAVDYGLVDALMYRTEVEDTIMKMAGQKNEDKLRTANVSQIASMKSSKHSANTIAVVYAEGEIIDDNPSTSMMENNISQGLVKKLYKLRKDDDVKAVVLRVNSPGGSAFVSDQIWKQVYELNKVKPVVVSMGDYAASGGYYISCAASRIVAEPNTLTGSIGIFGMFPNAEGLFSKLALTSDVVKTNDFSDLGDITRPMREDEKALIQGYIDQGYRTFVSRCAQGRHKTTAEIDSIGQGRVWTGEQALQRGLVDKLGGMGTAIKEAASLASLKDYAVRDVSGSTDYLNDIINKAIGDVRLKMVRSTLGEDYELFRALDVVRHNQGVQARLPYDMKLND